MIKRIFPGISKIILILIGCLIGFTLNNRVSACECSKKNNFEQEFNNSKAVFIGEVITVANEQPDAIVTFKVTKMWKGERSEEIVIRTNKQGKACGFVFKEGEQYLVYAEGADKLRTDLCSRTAEIKAAAEDLENLKSKEPVAREEEKRYKVPFKRRYIFSGDIRKAVYIKSVVPNLEKLVNLAA